MQGDKYNNIRENPCNARSFQKNICEEHQYNSLCQREVCFAKGGLVIKVPESAVH